MTEPAPSVDLLEYLPSGLTFLGGIVVASIGALVTRSTSKDTNESAERRDTIADRDSLIGTISSQMEEMRKRMDTLETEVREVHTHNLSLVNFILRCITVFQRHGLENEIPKPLPKGVEL